MRWLPMPRKNSLARAILTISLVVALLGFLTMDAAAFLYLLGFDSGWWFLLGLAATAIGCLSCGLIGSLFLKDKAQDT